MRAWLHALLRKATCMQRLQMAWPEVLEAYLQAWQFRPTRAEPLYEIAHAYRLREDWALGHLFAERAAAIPISDDEVCERFASTSVEGQQSDTLLHRGVVGVRSEVGTVDLCGLGRLLGLLERPAQLKNRGAELRVDLSRAAVVRNSGLQLAQMRQRPAQAQVRVRPARVKAMPMPFTCRMPTINSAT